MTMLTGTRSHLGRHLADLEDHAIYIMREVAATFERPALLFTEVVAHHAIDHKDAIHAFRRGEGLAAGQVAPLVRADDAAGFEPFQLGREAAHNFGAGGIGGANFAGGAGHLPHLRADAVHLTEIGAHAFQHDAPVDVDHVGVAHLAAVDHVGHLHAGAEFVGLGLHGENADFARLHVVEYVRRACPRGGAGPGLRGSMLRGETGAVQFGCERGGDFGAGVVGDEGGTSSGWMRRQLSTALRAPGVRAGSNWVSRSRCLIPVMRLLPAAASGVNAQAWRPALRTALRARESGPGQTGFRAGGA